MGYVEWTEPITATTTIEQVTTTVTTEVKPKETTTKAIVTTAKPKETSTKILETTAKPVPTTTKSVATTAKPVTTTTKLVVTTTKPVTTTTKLVVTTTKAIITTTSITTTEPITTTTNEPTTIPEIEFLRPVQFIGIEWNVRTSPEISRTNIVDYLENGDIFFIRRPCEEEDWYSIVRYNQSERTYVRIDEVNFQTLLYDSAVYYGEGRNVRSSMSLANDDNIISYLQDGDVVMILEKYADGWTKIMTNRVGSTQDAYIYGDVLSLRYQTGR